MCVYLCVAKPYTTKANPELLRRKKKSDKQTFILRLVRCGSSEESKNSTGYKFMTCENDMDRDSNKKIHFICFFRGVPHLWRGDVSFYTVCWFRETGEFFIARKSGI